jgi:hypothetical protein
MAYNPLTIDPRTPTLVKQLIRSVEDHYLRDVHTMLRLPQTDHDMPAGCNFAITQVLCAVVSGISVTLYDSETPGIGERFKGLLANFYPWAREPVKIDPTEGAEVIYHVFRNPLTHDLGVDLKDKKRNKKVVVKRLGRLTESLVEQIETDVRVVTPSPTLTMAPDRTVLLVEAFYSGVRTMIEALSSDDRRMQIAQLFLLTTTATVKQTPPP